MMELTSEFGIVACYNCHFSFALPKTIYTMRLSDGKTFYCPICKAQLSFDHKVEIQKLQTEVERLTSDIEYWRRRVDMECRHANALKGQITKLKNQLRAQQGKKKR